jgi:hypothetical protein
LNGRRVDDDATRSEVRQSPADDVKHRHDIDLERALDALGAELRERLHRLSLIGRVVDDDIQSTEL